MTSRVLSLLCFLVVSLGSTIQADDVDEQRFLKEVLPVWEEFTRWKGLEWGKMSWAVISFKGAKARIFGHNDTFLEIEDFPDDYYTCLLYTSDAADE